MTVHVFLRTAALAGAVALQAPAKPAELSVQVREGFEEALRPDEVEPYLRHRIEVAGGKYEQVFEPGVESIFYGASLGCPRLISLVADRSLLAAFSRQRAPVPREIVEQKAAQVANATRPAAPAATDRAAAPWPGESSDAESRLRDRASRANRAANASHRHCLRQGRRPMTRGRELCGRGRH